MNNLIDLKKNVQHACSNFQYNENAVICCIPISGKLKNIRILDSNCHTKLSLQIYGANEHFLVFNQFAVCCIMLRSAVIKFSE